MDWINIITSTLSFVCVLYITFSKQYAKNFADLLYQRDLAYEAEKGKNLATKEDISGLTKQVEAIKAEVNFEAERKHSAIERMQQYLVDISYHAEVINVMWNNSIIHAKDFEHPEVLMQNVDRIGESSLQLRHLGNLLVSMVDLNKTDITKLSNLIDAYQIYGAEISTKVQNIHTYLTSDKYFKEEDPLTYLHTHKTICENIDAFLLSKFTKVTKEDAKNLLNEYCVWLHNQCNNQIHLVGFDN